mgnify:CR=1 FL=1
MTVSELLERVDSHELTEWMTYYRIEQEPKEEKPDPGKLSENLKKQFAGMK